jgi:urease accessory protein
VISRISDNSRVGLKCLLRRAQLPAGRCRWWVSRRRSSNCRDGENRGGFATHLGAVLHPSRRIALTAAPLVALTFGSASAALAHTGTGSLGGFSSGFQHPLFGADHLLAMLAVGIWGAQMGGRRVWTLPVTFPLIMAFGGVVGMTGLYLPHVEIGIALSVLALGLAIAFAWRPFEWVALLLIAAFVLFHGYAHGVELPAAEDPAAYSAGFVIATGLIHVAGIGIGLATGRIFNGGMSRAFGAAIAAFGVYFLVTAA